MKRDADQRLLSLWRARFDTYDIARLTGLKEGYVAARLPKLRAAHKQKRLERIKKIRSHDPLLASLVENNGDAA